MRTTLSLCFGLLAGVICHQAHADIDVRVGAGAACTTASIQTAINNANPVNGVTNILIARNTSYTTNWLNITSKNVRLIGGFADCNQMVRDDIRTTISGAGGSKDSVIKVRGITSVVEFQNLDIVGGDAIGLSAGNHGGGVEIEDGPHARVHFENTWIHDNEAVDGGGLWIKNEHSTTASDVFVSLGDNTRIFGNRARRIDTTTQGYGSGDGGGIWCSNARVTMSGNVTDTIGSFIAGNSADDAGGGIRAENCVMHIASTSASVPTVSGNTASGSGGGISVSGERADITLYTRNPLAPTLISDNVAGGVGGGIDIGSSARVRAFDIIIADNIARSGGGAVSLFDNDAARHASFSMRGTLESAPGDAGSAEGVAVNCAAFHRCNRIQFNRAIQTNGGRRTGAALRVSAVANYVTTGPSVAVDVRGTEIMDNSGENVLEMTGDNVFVSFNGVALLGNFVTNELLHAPGNTHSLKVLWSTIAGNVGGTATFRSSMNGSVFAPTGTVFKNSIHWQPGKRIYSVVNGTVNANNTDFLLSNDLAGIPVSNHNLVTDPQFVDSATLNFHLTSTSPAVDFAPADASAATADHLPRLQDLGSVVNEFGAQDLGAYETPARSRPFPF